MLIVRNEQMRRLSLAHDDALAQAIAGKLDEDFPIYRAQLCEARVAAVVREAVTQAREFGLGSDQEVGEFVGLVFVCGERFFEQEGYLWAGELLRSGQPGRVRRVSEVIAARLQARAGGEP
ncbi:hypothetical protein ACLESO_32850 [Pyxidicoccus sp. 3LG]